MAEPELDRGPEEKEPFVPASFEKRTAAWMAIGYMLMLLFVVTFSIFTGGKPLPGTFPLLLIPASIAAAVTAIHRQHCGTAPGGLPLVILVVVLCAAGVVLGMALGVPALVYALQHAYS